MRPSSLQPLLPQDPLGRGLPLPLPLHWITHPGLMFFLIVFVCFSDLGSVKRPLEGLVILLGHLRSTLGVFGSFWWVLGRLLGAFGRPGPSLGRLWSTFGALWVTLGRLWGVFGPLWVVPGPPLVVFGGSWGCLGGVFGPSWALGPKKV